MVVVDLRPGEVGVDDDEFALLAATDQLSIGDIGTATARVVRK
jgi:hypothetical protein